MPNPSEGRVITPRLLRDWPLPAPDGDKTTRGTVLVVGGSRFTPGGVLLAGVAALRAGAGRLQLAAAGSSAAALSIAVPEAKVLGLPETPGGSVRGAPPAALLALAAEADAVALGPGLDDIDETRTLLEAVLAAVPGDRPVVLDAYALGALSTRPRLAADRPTPVVLTPNLTEAEVLLGGPVGGDLPAAALAIAGRYRAVVSLHGRVATADGRCWVEESGHPGLGTSGSGDARTGIVAGLLARGAAPAQAACWAAYVHAASGQRLTPRHGATGYLARELVDEVAHTLATL